MPSTPKKLTQTSMVFHWMKNEPRIQQFAMTIVNGTVKPEEIPSQAKNLLEGIISSEKNIQDVPVIAGRLAALNEILSSERKFLLPEFLEANPEAMTKTLYYMAILDNVLSSSSFAVITTYIDSIDKKVEKRAMVTALYREIVSNLRNSLEHNFDSVLFVEKIEGYFQQSKFHMLFSILFGGSFCHIYDLPNFEGIHDEIKKLINRDSSSMEKW